MVVSLQAIEEGSGASNSKRSNSKSLSELELARFELGNLLQSTLDLKTLLRYFLENSREKLTIDGLYYSEAERDIKIKLGKQSAHSCGYRLTNAETACGEIVFKRDSRFSEIELETIESNILILLAPISNALSYRDAVASANRNTVLQISKRASLNVSLSREVELAKRHNHPLAIVRIYFTNSHDLEVAAIHAERIDAFAEVLHKSTDSINLLYRAASNEFFLISPISSAAVALTLDSIKQSYELLVSDSNQTSPELQLGVATVTGTDSVKSVVERAKKNLITI